MTDDLGEPWNGTLSESTVVGVLDAFAADSEDDSSDGGDDGAGGPSVTMHHAEYLCLRRGA